MKAFALLATLAGLAESLPQFDLGSIITGGRAEKWTLLESTPVTPKYRNDTKRVILKYGNFVLHAKGVIFSTMIVFATDKM